MATLRQYLGAGLVDAMHLAIRLDLGALQSRLVAGAC